LTFDIHAVSNDTSAAASTAQQDALKVSMEICQSSISMFASMFRL